MGGEKKTPKKLKQTAFLFVLLVLALIQCQLCTFWAHIMEEDSLDVSMAETYPPVDVVEQKRLGKFATGRSCFLPVF